MDMEISDSDESINRSRRKASRLRILSSSSDEDFVNLNSEVNECSTEEENVVSKSENEDHDEEWQEVKERTSPELKIGCTKFETLLKQLWIPSRVVLNLAKISLSMKIWFHGEDV
ncbi:hypothetical protein KPH14_012714 [Odynerus spinipes]|uniref:Uncharacterized protein n=1 Tax=Odynerus spinipes TaxID=1348599 RepID=A0AAD9RDU1_9HYME|nr:hypothetical protein KPH14_012714 [Odynerus spinipes]